MPPAQRASVLVVDDESSIRESLRMTLEFEGYRVEEAATGIEALQIARDRPPDAILLDLRMPEMDGLDTLQQLRERGYDMPVLVISGHADVPTAVEATRKGAFDFFEKPLERDRVLLSLRNAVESWRLRKEVSSLPRAEGPAGSLVGTSTALRKLRETIERAAPTPATVLITGESGTGKELVARALHELSPRREQPFVRVNCAAIPEELIESELFGHEKGSFTGAVRKQIGKFVAADGGTIFLDEVGDLSARAQAKVLRVLESGDVEPVGAEKGATVDVRVIAATNRELAQAITDGGFREDLYYRLDVVPIRTPPLREHMEDLEPLVEHFARTFAETANYRRKTFSAGALDLLAKQPWKGNVRELRNVVERLLILAPGDEVSERDVASIVGGPGPELAQAFHGLRTLKEFREQAEKLFLLQKLDENGWNVTRTAEAIETPRSNLYKKLDQYGIRRSEETTDGG